MVIEFITIRYFMQVAVARNLSYLVTLSHEKLANATKGFCHFWQTTRKFVTIYFNWNILILNTEMTSHCVLQV